MKIIISILVLIIILQITMLGLIGYILIESHKKLGDQQEKIWLGITDINNYIKTVTQ